MADRHYPDTGEWKTALEAANKENETLREVADNFRRIMHAQEDALVASEKLCRELSESWRNALKHATGLFVDLDLANTARLKWKMMWAEQTDALVEANRRLDASERQAGEERE